MTMHQHLRHVTYPGVGPITSTDSTTSAVCYQNINYNNTPKPTSFPTEKPTLKPTSKVRETKSYLIFGALNHVPKGNFGQPTSKPTTWPTSWPTPQPTPKPTMKPTSA
ncbi:hypothetical protein HJC23_011892, partial [Cyclotella cryptica]